MDSFKKPCIAGAMINSFSILMYDKNNPNSAFIVLKMKGIKICT